MSNEKTVLIIGGIGPFDQKFIDTILDRYSDDSKNNNLSWPTCFFRDF